MHEPKKKMVRASDGVQRIHSGCEDQVAQSTGLNRENQIDILR